jgi:hypothetical protein
MGGRRQEEGWEGLALALCATWGLQTHLQLPSHSYFQNWMFYPSQHSQMPPYLKNPKQATASSLAPPQLISSCPARPPCCHALTVQEALLVAQVTGGEAMYDQRLFNQETGTGTGFGGEDSYNLYDKPLFADRSELFRHKVGQGRVPSVGGWVGQHGWVEGVAGLVPVLCSCLSVALFAWAVLFGSLKVRWR